MKCALYQQPLVLMFHLFFFSAWGPLPRFFKKVFSLRLKIVKRALIIRLGRLFNNYLREALNLDLPSEKSVIY